MPMINYSEDAARQYHIGTAAGEVGKYVILPGDPGRCVQIAAYLENPEKIAGNREFVTYTGFLGGTKVSVTSTGIGGPSASIAMEELVRCGADTFVRVGTCGGMQPEVKSGDLVIVTGAVRMEGTSREYAPIEYPAVADYEVLSALADAAQELGMVYHVGSARECALLKENGAAEESAVPETGAEVRRLETSNNSGMADVRGLGTSDHAGMAEKTEVSYHIGVVQSKDSFYGQHEPEAMPAGFELQAKWEAWKRMGCLASEMESAALFIAAGKLHVRVGTCLLVLANQERAKLGLPNPVVRDTDLAVRTAVQAVRLLIARDGGGRN